MAAANQSARLQEPLAAGGSGVEGRRAVREL